MKCRYCGSNNTTSQGLRMLCKNCNRQSAKVPRLSTPHAEDRPICPECGTSNPYSASFLRGVRRWVCRSCGRYYTEKSKRVKSMNPDTVLVDNLEVQIE